MKLPWAQKERLVRTVEDFVNLFPRNSTRRTRASTPSSTPVHTNVLFHFFSLNKLFIDKQQKQLIGNVHFGVPCSTKAVLRWWKWRRQRRQWWRCWWRSNEPVGVTEDKVNAMMRCKGRMLTSNRKEQVQYFMTRRHPVVM